MIRMRLAVIVMLLLCISAGSLSEMTPNLKLSSESETVFKGKKLTLKVTGPSGKGTNYAWTSTDDSIATVKNGIVEGKNCGECDIICESQDEDHLRGTCHIRVIQPIQSLTTDKKLTIPYGKSSEINVVIKPADATVRRLDWSVSDASVCRVDENGIVTALSAGDCTITCTAADGSNKTAAIKVHVPVFDSPEAAYTVTEKEGLTIPVELHGIGPNGISHKSNSGNNYLYCLDEEGLHIFPIKAGKGTITLTSNINKADKTVYNITVDDSAIYKDGENEPLRAFVFLDKSNYMPGDKAGVSYYVTGGQMPYSMVRLEYVTNDGWSYGTKEGVRLTKLPSGECSVNVSKYGGKVFYAVLKAADANGQGIAVQTSKARVGGLSCILDYDVYAAKKGMPLELDYSISGGSGQYSIEATGRMTTDVGGVNVQIYSGKGGANGKIEYTPQAKAGTAIQITITAVDQKNKKLMAAVTTPEFIITDDYSIKVSYDKEELLSGDTLNAYFFIDGLSFDEAVIAYNFSYKRNDSSSVFLSGRGVHVSKGTGKVEKEADGIWRLEIKPDQKGFFGSNILFAGDNYGDGRVIEVR